MREAELLDELADSQELQNPNWDLGTRIQMCAEAVAYGKLRPEVAELAFGEHVFAQAMPLVAELVIKKISTEGVQRRPASPAATAHRLSDRIRSIPLLLRAIPLLLRDVLSTAGRFIFSSAIIAVSLFVGFLIIRTADNFLHGKGLYSGTVPDAAVLTIIEPTSDTSSGLPSEKESGLRARIISDQVSDIVRKLAPASADVPSADEEQRAVREILESSEQVNESLQKLERKIRELSQTLKVDTGLKISHDGFNIKLVKTNTVPL